MKVKTQENKSVKTLKGQLFGAVAMMLVAAIALGTSTYAWFINNRTVEVQQMDLQVSTSTSMLVAVGKKGGDLTGDAGWTGYKSVITKEDIIGTGADQGGWAVDAADGKAAYNLLSVKLTPASVCNFALTTEKPDFYMTNNHVSGGFLDQFTEVTLGATDETVGMGPVKYIPLKFKSSADLDVYFGKKDLNNLADMIVAANLDAEAGKIGEVTLEQQAAAIRKALRIAIVPENNTATDASYDKAVPIIFQFDGGNKEATDTNNTSYASITSINQIYAETGSDTAVTTGELATVLAGLKDESLGKYAAIKAAATTNPWNITKVGIQQTVLPMAVDNGYVATVTMDGNSAEVKAPTTDGKYLFQLKNDKPRQVGVYMWLEGTDRDCLNVMSAYHFGVVLPFAAVETPTTPAP